MFNHIATRVRSVRVAIVLVVAGSLLAGLVHPTSNARAASVSGSTTDGSGTKSSKRETGLRKATLQNRTLTVTANCKGKGTVKVYSHGKRLGTKRLACQDGSDQVRLRLSRAAAKRANSEAGLKLAVRVADQAGASSTDLAFSRPDDSRGKQKPTAHTAANQIWKSATTSCLVGNGIKYQSVAANFATFGYPFGKRIEVRAVIHTYTPSTNKHTYTSGQYLPHDAGMGNPGTTGQPAVWTFQHFGSKFYTRAYIEVRGGDWNWVQRYDMQTMWCYWA